MVKVSKRKRSIEEKVTVGKMHSLKEALELLKKCSAVKFQESVDIAVNLGIDARKSDQAVRGSVVMPNGTGRKVRVAVFAQGDNVEKAKNAGADLVGLEDLAESIKAGNIDFDVVIATPDTMRVVGQLGQVLGPKGLMPNPKVGTVTADVATAVKNAKSGQVQFRTDKNGIIHCAVGKIDFEVQQLHQNIETLINELKRVKPSTAKGVYLKKLTISSTMGPGLAVDISTVV